MAIVFFSYAHTDEDLRDQLEKHLTMLKRQGVIETFHDRRIVVGSEVDQSISAELERAGATIRDRSVLLASGPVSGREADVVPSRICRMVVSWDR